MTREDLIRLATKPDDSLDTCLEDDVTYKVVEVFKDTSFLKELSRKKDEDKKKRALAY